MGGRETEEKPDDRLRDVAEALRCYKLRDARIIRRSSYAILIMESPLFDCRISRKAHPWLSERRGAQYLLPENLHSVHIRFSK